MNQSKLLKSIIYKILFLQCWLSSNAQTIITCDSTSSNIFGNPTMSIRSIDVSGCSAQFIDDEELTVVYPKDINILGDGTIFGYGFLQTLPPNIPNNFFRYAQPFGGIFSDFTNLLLDPSVEGLTCDETNGSFAAGVGITRYELPPFGNDYIETYLGDLPPDMQCLGDITYRRGKFYMSAIGNKLVEVNMKDPSKSQIVMYFPPGTLPIHGLTTVQVGCDSMITYAIGREYSFSKIYELDFNNWTITEVCQIDRVVTGAGAQTECMLPPCDLFIDLDNDNSSLAFWGNYCADAFCTTPIAVADTDVVVLSIANTLDSMLLELTGIQNGALEYLETNLPPGTLTVLGNGNASLLFINNGAATLTDFENALKSVVYQNMAVPLAYGMRQVRVTGWSGGVASIVSTADLPLSNNVLQVGHQASMPTCHGLGDGSLAVQVNNGTAPYSYQWQQGSTDSLLLGIGAGSYTITITDDAGCIKLDTFELMEPDTLLVNITNTGLSPICNDAGSLLGTATGGTLPYGFAWDNGATGPSNSSIGSGDYILTVVDSNGCSSSASYTILSGDTILTMLSATICNGESFAWNGLTLAADTLVCQVFTPANGCDSTACLTLSVNPSPLPQINSSGSLCNGASVALTVGQFASYEWSSGEVSPEIMVQDAGNYGVTVTNSFGCTAIANITVQPGIDFDYAIVQPSCFGLNDGSIIIENVSTGTPPFLFSADSLNFFQDGEFLNLPGGQYWPSVQDATGCKVVESVVLDTPQAILLDAGTDQTTQLGVPVNLMANANLPNLAFLWQPSDFLDCPTCPNAVASPTTSIVYTVIASDVNGCEAKDSVAIFVDGERRYYIPTAFSPNDDGINDGFTVYSDASIEKIVSFEVYDRWGDRVFHSSDIPTNDPSKGWNGLFKGKVSMSGLYVYVAKLLWVDGRLETVRGEVNLMR